MPAPVTGAIASAAGAAAGNSNFGSQAPSLLNPTLKEAGIAASPVARAHRKLLRADVAKLISGRGLGLTEAEKQQGASGAILSAQAATQGLVDEARRTGNYGLLATLGQQVATAGSQAMTGMEQMSQQLAEQRAQSIRARMAEKYAEANDTFRSKSSGGGAPLAGLAGEGSSTEDLQSAADQSRKASTAKTTNESATGSTTKTGKV